MGKLWAALAVTALLALSPSAGAKPRPAVKSAAIDWTRRVAETPEGGYVMGNPAARLHLVEYGSLTCNHCANFERDGARPLMTYIRRGQVRWEFRQWVRDPLDMAAGLASRCEGARNVFASNRRLFASQEQWMGRVSDDDYAHAEQLDLPDQMKTLARIAGLDSIVVKAGVPAAKLSHCLSNRAEVDKLIAIRNSQQGQSVQGTPTFSLNGVEIAPTSADRWPGIEAVIKSRLTR